MHVCTQGTRGAELCYVTLAQLGAVSSSSPRNRDRKVGSTQIIIDFTEDVGSTFFSSPTQNFLNSYNEATSRITQLLE